MRFGSTNPRKFLDPRSCPAGPSCSAGPYPYCAYMGTPLSRTAAVTMRRRMEMKLVIVDQQVIFDLHPL